MKRIFWQYLIGCVMTLFMTILGTFVFPVAPKTFFVGLVIVGIVLSTIRRPVLLMMTASILSIAAGVFAIITARGDATPYTSIAALLCGVILAGLPRTILPVVNQHEADDILSEGEEPATEVQYVVYMFAQAAGTALVGGIEAVLLVAGMCVVVFVGKAISFVWGRQRYPRCPACLGQKDAPHNHSVAA